MNYDVKMQTGAQEFKVVSVKADCEKEAIGAAQKASGGVVVSVTPQEEIYTVGKIVEYSWGYDQTNIDYFVITARKGQFVTLQSIGKKNVTETGFMAGRCEPDPEKILDKKPLRRKVHRNRTTGKESGIAVRSYGWANLWDGKPSQWTNYA